MPQNFVEKTFTNSRKTTKLVKVFSLKSFLLYGATSSVTEIPTISVNVTVNAERISLYQFCDILLQ